MDIRAYERRNVSTRRDRVFFSYAHEDEVLRQELEKHLSLLKRQGFIRKWHDRNISAGRDWAHEINMHLNAARIILLLISVDFIASDYCYSIEMERAMERHASGEARVIPIILRPADWRDAPFGKLEALPTDAKPVTSPIWHLQDEAFLNVTEGIRKAVKELTENPLLSKSRTMIPSSGLVPLPISSKRDIKITMLGAAGAGKTSFMTAMYAAMREGIKGFTLTTKTMDEDLDLSDIWDRMTETQGESRWPTATSQEKLYSFQFNYALRGLLTVNWLDYRGGALDERPSRKDVADLHHHLEQSSHLFLCISGEYLTESTNGHGAAIRSKARINRMLISKA